MASDQPQNQSALDRVMRDALGHHQAGRLAEAERIYRHVLAGIPDHAGALHLLGVLSGQRGDAVKAVDLIGRAVAINPGVAEYHGNLGEAYRKAGQLELALVRLRHAIELKPDLAEAHANLGNVLRLMGRVEEAMAELQRAVALDPDQLMAHSHLGLLLQAAGRHDEAAGAFAQVVRLRPEDARAQDRLAIALHAAGRLTEAIAALRRSIALEPGRAQTYGNLGVALKDSGQAEAALAAYRRALELKPDQVKIHVNLGALLLDSGQAPAAVAHLRRAIELEPNLVEAHYNLGIALYRGSRLDESIEAYRRAIELKGDHGEAHNGLGVAALVAGRGEEAAGHLQTAVRLRPTDVSAHSNLAMCALYSPGVTLAGLARAHAEWAERHAARYLGGASARPGNLDRDAERPLRLGFVSADFRTHPVGCFLAPALEGLKPHPCAVVCYHNWAGRDDITRRLAAAADEWHDVCRLDDDALADRIRGDRIDILFDLSGHTEGNRLLAFARRPAPIQIAWLGYPGTTGLAAMDYLLADRFQVPPQAEVDAHYRESVVRMPSSYVCFDPPGEAPAVGPLPALARGQITFGSFNNLAKLAPDVIALWGEILRRVPDARLLLGTRGLGAEGTRKRIHEAFAAAGADPVRVELRGKALRHELLAAYNEVDVALDPFPYSGGMTTCEALWMGVPVVTCPGETFASRHSFGHLSNAGLTETIATDHREYVELAVPLAHDVPHLAALRAGLRDQMLRSPLCDGAKFAHDLMAVLRDVWRQWCHE